MLEPELQAEILHALEQQLPDVHAISQDLPYQCTDLLAENWNGFSVSRRTSYVLSDIHQQDELYDGIKSDYRKNKLPKAEKHYVLDTEVPLETFLQLHAGTYKRQKMRLPASDAYFRQLDAALAENNARLILGAKHIKTGEIHAVSYVIADKTTCYLLASADIAEHRANAPSIFVLWHAILMGNSYFQVREFDFLGSMVKKIASVRKQFGAKTRIYLRIERSKFWLKWLKKVVPK